MKNGAIMPAIDTSLYFVLAALWLPMSSALLVCPHLHLARTTVGAPATRSDCKLASASRLEMVSQIDHGAGESDSNTPRLGSRAHLNRFFDLDLNSIRPPPSKGLARSLFPLLLLTASIERQWADLSTYSCCL